MNSVADGFWKKKILICDHTGKSCTLSSHAYHPAIALMVEEIILINIIHQTKITCIGFFVYVDSTKFASSKVYGLKSNEVEGLYLAGVQSLPLVLYSLRGFHNYCLQTK